MFLKNKYDLLNNYNLLNNKKLFLTSIMFSLLFVFLMPIFGEKDIITETQERLDEITEEEKVVVENLYRLDQEIIEAEKKEETIAIQIDEFQGSVLEIEEQITSEQFSFDTNKDVLEEILKIYQKKGPGTFIETLLDSENLGDFLGRLNILRDLTQGTGEILEDLEESKVLLEAEKIKLEEILVLIQDEQEKLVLVLEEKRALVEEQESYLASLEEKRLLFEELLAEVKAAWEDLKPIFYEASKGFSKLAESGNLPPEALQIGFSFDAITATISEEDFNEAILESKDLPDMIFTFNKDSVTLQIDEYHLVLKGNFVLIEENVLLFETTEGSFYDIPLEITALDELFEKGGLTLDLKPIALNNIIKSVESEEGKIILDVKISLF